VREGLEEKGEVKKNDMLGDVVSSLIVDKK